MLRHLWLAAIILGCSKPAESARTESAGETPEAAAQAFGDALKANDWAAAARLMHPEALSQLRSLFQPIMASEGGDQMAAQLFGVQSRAELATLPDTVMFASFLRNVLNQQPGLADAIRTATFTPLGHVNGGADTVLVVSRMAFTVEGMTISQFDVMPFIQDAGQWRGLLKADFTNMAAMIQRSMGGPQS